jgi:UDP-N-acetylglucosamine 2-epimerase (non-hydrolysing)
MTQCEPDMVIVQGDTTTVFCAAMAAFYHRIPVGHVEAGLRTWNKFSPYPEEINRVLVSRLADLHFAPTETAKQNLLKEQVPEEQIFVTGNTVIDALFIVRERVLREPPRIPSLPDFIQPGTGNGTSRESRMVLITGHRRENFGQGFENICRAIRELSEAFPGIHFVYPVHMNPKVREPVQRILGTNGDLSAKAFNRTNIHLINPVGYLEFVALMGRCHLILTDSGGVQEEAPSLGKPVLVMRDTTERPEAVHMGTVKLVGTDQKTIVENTKRLLNDQDTYMAMANAVNPYGDGQATNRILSTVMQPMTEGKQRP